MWFSRGFGISVLLLLSVVPAARAGDDWLPVPPEELQMTSVPEAPGAPAVYLYEQVDRDDLHGHEKVYTRIKILTEAGLSRANVEIPFVKDSEHIYDLAARTIRPDGSVVNFKDTVYEKNLVNVRSAQLLAKTFTFPQVAPGCIVEFRYTRQFDRGRIYNSRWILSQDLFLRSGRFSLVPSPLLVVRWSWPNRLPEGTAPPRMEKGLISLETHNVPAFVSEDHMPPENELRYRVDFIYSSARSNPETDSEAFWKNEIKAVNPSIQEFLDKPKVMNEAVSQIVAPGDDADAKLRKIYLRVAQMRNLTYERQKSEQERERENLSRAHDVGEVWKSAVGTRRDLTWLFVALARAAGLEADPVFVSTRDVYFFNKALMNPGELNVSLAVVSLGGKDLYFAPGVPYVSYGQLPWYETDCDALRLGANGGTWTQTPLPAAAESLIERHAKLTLADDELRGTVTVRFTGLEASWRRQSQRNDDEVGRRQFLEHEVEHFVPGNATVRLTSSPDWSSSDQPLTAEFELHVPNWATASGHRVLLPVGLFGASERHTFEHSERLHPIYFLFPCRYSDELSITLPEGWKVESTPARRNLDMKGVVFESKVEKSEQTLTVTRDLVRNMYFAPLKYYPPLQHFYQTVRTSDDEAVVLTPSGAHP